MERKKFILGLAIAFVLAATVGVFLIPKNRTEGLLPTVKHGSRIAATNKEGNSLAAQIKVYESLVQRDPDNIEHRARLGGLYFRRGDWDRAKEHFAEAVELDPHNVQLRTRLAMTYWHGGDTNRGIQQLDEAIGINPSLIDARFYKAILLSKLAERKSEAIGELRKVIELAPGSRFAREARAQLMELGVKDSVSPLPKELGGLILKAQSAGREAIAQINKMHNQQLPITTGYVGTYIHGKSTKSAKLWIAESDDPDGLLQRMLDEIRGGDTPFSVPEEVEGLGPKIYSSKGMEQHHYIWSRKTLLIWLSLKDFSSDEALAFLKDALKLIGTG